MYYWMELRKKLSESANAVLPTILIVMTLSLTVVPMTPETLLAFLLGSVLLVFGMMFFSLGAELSMEIIGERLGAGITKTRNLCIVLFAGFLLGFMITVSEPDLQVLANQVQSIPNIILISSVAAGVGVFLVAALLRMFLGIPLQIMLIGFYILVFVLAYFTPSGFMAVAFDSGGVTTGPMTVPFIMAFGIGISAIRSDRRADDDSFGLVALCSIGPILAVLLLGLIYAPDNTDYASTWLLKVEHSVEMGGFFFSAFPKYLHEMAASLVPIALFFALFQIVRLRLGAEMLIRIAVGLLYTYVGLVLFLTGANVGFMPAGAALGQMLAVLDFSWIIIPIGMTIGFFIIRAEPAVYVLMRQVEELTNGALSGKAMQNSLSVGVALSVGLAMMRVLTGLPILWLLLPGYALAMIMSFFVPKIFTAIAFDSGGVASGPMTATFLLPFAMGACLAVGGNIVTDAFGVVAMVAMTPLITIQGLGMAYKLKSREAAIAAAPRDAFAHLDDYAIIEL